jgi:uncharacterized protein RhaS with RHS repeats
VRFQLSCTVNCFAQQFTLKERDVETGLDYFGARYYTSTQGRFSGPDPYDINFERQSIVQQEKAESLFRDYIKQPQHWNHYAYALNNPLRYIDPDGNLEYETELLGKMVKINITDKIEKSEQEEIKTRLDAAIAKINAGAEQLTSEQIHAINSLKRIEIRNDVRATFTNPNNKVLNMTTRLAQHPTLDYLAIAIIHESYHADQIRRGLPFNGVSSDGKDNYGKREMEASGFAVDVGKQIGLAKEVIDTYAIDAKKGHGPVPGSIYVKPLQKKKKTP